MSHKRRWWLADERFKKVHRDLRLNYKAAEKRIREECNAEIEKVQKQCNERVKREQELAAQRVEEANRQAQRFVNEVSRVRMEYGPFEFGTRFMMTAHFSESFIIHARDLKEMSRYIIDMLCAGLKREFSQLDWQRSQPVVPSLPPTGRHYPTFRLDLGGPEADPITGLPR